MAIATLSVDIEARLARFEEGVNRANGLLEKLSRGATSASQRIGEFFAGAFGANVAADALNRVIGLFPAVIDGVLAIKDLSEATGSSVENISALDDIARRAGGSLQQVEGVLIKFNAALKEADGKNGVSQALKALGLDAAELRKIDPAEALLRTAQALEEFADDGNRARVAQELFGKGVKDASTFLRDLAEAGKLNAKVTSEQAEAVDQFDKNIAKLRTNISELARTAVGELLPKVNEVFERLAALDKVYGSVGAGLAANFGKKQFSDAADGVAFYTAELAKLQAKQAQLASSGNAFARLFAGDVDGDVEAARKALAFYERVAIAQGKFAGGGRGFVNPAPALPKPSLPGLLTGGDKPKEKENVDFVNKALADLIAKTDVVKFGEINAQLERLQQFADEGLDPRVVEQVRALILPPQGDKMGPPISDELARVNELLKQTDSSKLAAALRDASLLRDQLSQVSPGTQRWLELTDALIDVETQIDSLAGAIPELTKQFDDGAQQLRSTIEGTLGATFGSMLRGEFDNIGKLWANLLIDMAARALAADLLGALFGKNAGTSGGPGAADYIGAFFRLFGGASAKGNAFGPAGMIPFATGGIVTGATPFAFGNGKLGVMGEAGPEAILPLKRGPGGRLGVSAQGMGGQSGPVITQVFHVNGDVSPGTVALVQGMIDRSNARLMRDMRTGQMAGA